jgi:Succinate dehydrogenase/fumarate reductase, flavoprotein subunit
MLEPFRTSFRYPLKDFLLYSRKGPRIIRLSIPGCEPKELREKRFKTHHPAKVIVIGSGLAGLSAAIEAADAKANVIILEKELKTGGNSAKATSGINGWGTNTQARLNIADDERLFERDTHRSGVGGLTHPSLVRTLSTQSAPSVHWLQNKFQIPLDVVSQLGGHSARRTHRAPPDEHGRPVPIGHLIMSTMRAMIEKNYSDKIEIRCGSKVRRLLHHTCVDGIRTITGVEVEQNGSCYEEYGDSVILATGGFGSDNGLMARFRPDLLGVPTTNGKFAQGEGVLLGETVGAQLLDMDKVQLHPTGFIDPKDPSNQTKILAPEAIRGSGGILVNSEGRRFVNELDLRSVVTKAILRHCSCYKDGNHEGPPFAWCILSKASQEIFGLPALRFYKEKMGLFEFCADITEISKLIGCDESILRQTLRDYSNAMKAGNCPITKKHIFPAELSENSTDLIVARVTPSSTCSMCFSYTIITYPFVSLTDLLSNFYFIIQFITPWVESA